MIELGSTVLVKDLQKAPHFNGITGLIVQEKNKDGRYGVQLLDHAPSWKEDAPDKKLEVGGKRLLIKESNLSKSRDSPHWFIPNAKMSIFESIRVDPALVFEDKCDVFCQKIWNSMFETIPSVPLTETAFSKMKGHKIFWLSMDAIMHHLIIEKCRGRFRVYQTYIVENGMGFTAGEWCQIKEPNDLDPRLGPMHATFGGGKTVGLKEIDELLDRILELQKLNRSMIPSLVTHVDGLSGDSSSVPYFAKRTHEIPPELRDKVQHDLQLAVSWSHEHEKLVPGPLGLTHYVHDEPDEQITMDPIPVTQGSKLLFEIPKKHYIKARRINKNLTGQAVLSPMVFIRMINSGIWWEDRRGPDGGAVGYSIRLASLDESQSEDEGIRAAKEKASRVRKILGTE